jgi:hypothetical protein
MLHFESGEMWCNLNVSRWRNKFLVCCRIFDVLKISTIQKFLFFSFNFNVKYKIMGELGWRLEQCRFVIVPIKTNMYTGCLKIREFRIQSVVGRDPVELEKYLEKKNRSSWRRYKHFNFVQYTGWVKFYRPHD